MKIVWVWQGWGSCKDRKVNGGRFVADFIGEAKKSRLILLAMESHLRILRQRMTQSFFCFKTDHMQSSDGVWKYLPSSWATRISLPYFCKWYHHNSCICNLWFFWSKEGLSNHWCFHFCPKKMTVEQNLEVPKYILTTSSQLQPWSNFIFLLNL